MAKQGSPIDTLVKTRTRLAPEVRRQQILDAALNEFSMAGFEGATMDRIAHRVGITKAGLYAHFSGKDELFETLLAGIMLSLSHIDQWVWCECNSLEETIDQFLDTIYGQINTPRSMAIMRLLIGESGRNPERIQRWYKETYRPYMQKRHQILEAFIRKKYTSDSAIAQKVTLATSPALQAMLWQMIIGGDEAEREITTIRASHRELLLMLFSSD